MGCHGQPGTVDRATTNLTIAKWRNGGKVWVYVCSLHLVYHTDCTWCPQRWRQGHYKVTDHNKRQVEPLLHIVPLLSWAYNLPMSCNTRTVILNVYTLVNTQPNPGCFIVSDFLPITPSIPSYQDCPACSHSWLSLPRPSTPTVYTPQQTTAVSAVFGVVFTVYSHIGCCNYISRHKENRLKKNVTCKTLLHVWLTSQALVISRNFS